MRVQMGREEKVVVSKSKIRSDNVREERRDDRVLAIDVEHLSC